LGSDTETEFSSFCACFYSHNTTDRLRLTPPSKKGRDVIAPPSADLVLIELLRTETFTTETFYHDFLELLFSRLFCSFQSKPLVIVYWSPVTYMIWYNAMQYSTIR